MPLMTWELWLAREVVADNPLPWQKSMVKLTPGRVAQSIGGVLAAMFVHQPVLPKPVESLRDGPKESLVNKELATPSSKKVSQELKRLFLSLPKPLNFSSPYL